MTDTYSAKQVAIEAIFDHFTRVLGIPGHVIVYAKAIAKSLWDAFPRCTRWHAPEVFTEVLVFHALKSAGLPIDQAAFREASVLGDMVMSKRHWLLHYTRFVPPSLRVTSNSPGIEPFLAIIHDEAVETRARAIAAAHEHVLSRAKPSIRAGVCILLAIKAMPDYRGSAGRVLDRAGIRLGSAINAAKRLGLLGEKGSFNCSQCSPIATIA